MKIGDIETDNLTDEQLRELALGTADPDPQAKPRDDQGRFTIDPTPDPDPAPDPDEDPQPQEFVRTIDLGDGSGVQVFKGATAEEVTDKLVEAQRNASIKIRADHKTLKALQDKIAEYESRKSAAPLTDDEKFVLSQKLMSDPVAAQTEILERIGLNPKKLAAAIERIDADERLNTNRLVFAQWIEGHPEFNADSTSNGRKIDQFITHYHGGVFTETAIDQAYQVLKADGLLQEKPVTPTPTQQQPPPVRRTSGLSTRRSAPPAPPTQEDPYKLSMEELKRKANGGKDFGGW